jgi:hypothetical protein
MAPRALASAAIVAAVWCTAVAATGEARAQPAPQVQAPSRAANDATTPTAPSSAANDASTRPASRDDAAIENASLLDALTSSDPYVLEKAVSTVLLLPRDRAASPDVLFAAGRAAEDKLHDPLRAVALYERLIVDHPTARAAAAAARRAAAIREQIGAGSEGAALAGELARLIATADAQPVDAVIQQADRLADAAWPGAPAAALWLADWHRRAGRFAAAQARYDTVLARWPARPQAQAALRGATGCALDAHDWALAETLAQRLPALDPADRAVRDDLLAAAARGRRRERWYVAAWLAIAAAFAGLVASLVEATRRRPPGTRPWPTLRPPIEAVFFAPVAAVLVGVAFTAHRLIAPAVTTIALGGLALTWLSGAALEQLRAQHRARRLRSLAHAAACIVAVAALAYVALTRDQLLDMLVDTVRFGPEA